MGRQSTAARLALFVVVAMATVYTHHKVSSFVEKVEKSIEVNAARNTPTTNNNWGGGDLNNQNHELRKDNNNNNNNNDNNINNNVQHPWIGEPSTVDVNPIPEMNVLQSMQSVDIIHFFDGYIASTQTLCNKRVRMGRIQDGGWDVCEDPHHKIDSPNCLIYSFGINNDFSFDDAMEQYGCEVHSYDPSMAVNDHLRGQRVHFHKAGISGVNVNKSGEWPLFTLGTLRGRNGHSPAKRRVDIVKMDVEGAELKSLLKAVEEGSLQDVRQLSFEMHINVPRSKGNGDPKREYLLEMLRLLRQLWSMGFRLYHTNRNTNAPQLIYRSNLDRRLRTVCHELYMIRVHK